MNSWHFLIVNNRSFLFSFSTKDFGKITMVLLLPSHQHELMTQYGVWLVLPHCILMRLCTFRSFPSIELGWWRTFCIFRRYSEEEQRQSYEGILGGILPHISSNSKTVVGNKHSLEHLCRQSVIHVATGQYILMYFAGKGDTGSIRCFPWFLQDMRCTNVRQGTIYVSL